MIETDSDEDLACLEQAYSLLSLALHKYFKPMFCNLMRMQLVLKSVKVSSCLWLTDSVSDLSPAWIDSLLVLHPLLNELGACFNASLPIKRTEKWQLGIRPACNIRTVLVCVVNRGSLLALKHAVISQMLGRLTREWSLVLCQSTGFVMSLMPGRRMNIAVYRITLCTRTHGIYGRTLIYSGPGDRLLAYADANHCFKYKLHVCLRLSTDL